jgi:hypothetical protein
LQLGRSYQLALDLNGRIAAPWGACEFVGDPFNIGGGFFVNFLPNCPTISGNGKVIAFSSYADQWSTGDLVPTDPRDPNFARYLDVFVKDLTSIGPVPVPALNAKAMLLMALVLGLSALMGIRQSRGV